jgi:hypothetical protein
MALLGKISAVLTANTQDFSRQIGTARRELNQFAQQARGLQFNLDNRALNGTLTQLQRFQRTLREIQNLQRQGLGAGLPDPGRLRQQLRAFEDVGRPLTDVKNQVERLSNALQSQLTPELNRIQGGFQRLYREIGSGTTTISAAEQRIDNLRARIVALGRATAAAGDFGRLADALNANNTGGSFFQARARDSLQRSLDLRNRAQAVPAAFRSDVFADIAVQAEESAERVARAAARVARAQLIIANTERNGRAVTPRQLQFRGIAQQRLDSEVSRQETINSLFDRELRSASIRQIVSPQAASQVDKLTEKLSSLSAKLRDGDDQRFDGLISSVGRVIEQLNRSEVSAKRAKQAIEALAAADATKAFGRSGFDKADALIRTESERTIDKIRRDAQTQRNNIIGASPILGRRRQASVAAVNLREDIALSREEFNRSVAGRFDDLSSRVKDLKSAGVAGEFDKIRKLAADANSTLRSAFDAKTTAAGAQGLDNYRAKLAALLPELDAFESKLKSAETARKRFDQFLSISGSRSDKLGADLERAASFISTGRQLAGNFEAGNISGRRTVEQAIDRDLKFFEKLAAKQQKIADGKFKSEESRNRARRAVEFAARQRSDAFIDTVSDASREGGAIGISRDRARAIAERGLKNRGSFGVGSAAVAQLAAQQGLFAIDDLISATGGLEYRLRAIGNNITQLGLLLGQSGIIPGLSATTGLAIGLGVVIGGQVVSALLRYVTAAKEAEETSKALGKAFERQKNLASQVAQSVESFGNLGSAAFSEAARSASEFADSLEKIVRQQRELQGASLLTTDIAGVRRLSQDERLAQQQEEASSPGRAIAIRRQRALLARRISQDEERLLSLGQPSGADVSGAVAGVGTALDRARRNIQGITGTVDAIATGRLGESAGAAFGYDASPLLRAAAGRAQIIARGLPLGDSPADRAAQSSGIQDLIDQLSPIGNQTAFGFETAAAQAANQAILELEQLRLRLQGEGDLADFFKSLKSASQSLATAQENAAAALQRGIPEAVAIQGSLDALAEGIQASEKRISRANEDLSRGRIDDSERNRIVAEETAKIDASRAERDAATQAARALRIRSTVDPQGTPAAIAERAAAALQSSGFGSGAFARRLREIEAERTTVEESLKASPRDAVVREAAQAQLQSLAEQAAAVEAATVALSRFAEALDKAAQESAANVQAAAQREEEARRAVAAPGAANADRIDADRARRDLDEQRAADARVQDAVTAARTRIERDVDPNSESLRRIREINESLLAGNAANSDALIAERRRLQDQVDAAAQADPSAIAARDEANAIAERQNAEARGRELALSPAERAGRELGRNLRDLQAAFDAGQIGNPQDLAADQQRLIGESFRSAAPAIFGLADQVQNAVLQGPSRAALQASDVTTAQGAAELNRLLRGDDSARNQDLVELQKQSSSLEELVRIARENGAPPGVLNL